MLVVECVGVVGVERFDVTKAKVLIGGVVVSVDKVNDEDMSERRGSVGIGKGSGGGLDDSWTSSLCFFFWNNPWYSFSQKIFFSAYDRYREIKEYETTRKLNFPYTKVYPPKCVMEGHFEFCVAWFHYIKNDGFVHKTPDVTGRFSFNDSDFRRMWEE